MAEEEVIQENTSDYTDPNNKALPETVLLPEDVIRIIQQPGFYDIDYLKGIYETVTTVPTETPVRFNQAVKIYVDSLTAPTIKRLYVYSNQTNAWYGLDVLPSQTGNSGKFLTTNGSTLSWGNPGKFGGDGSDGALSVTSGTTTISASSSKVVTKNYTSITISSGATLAFSTPHTNGTLVILRCQGNVTIAGTVDLREMGAAKGTTAWGILDSSNHHGTSAAAGAQYSNTFLYLYNDSNHFYRKFIVLTPGSGGADGSGGTTDNKPGGAGSLFGAGGAAAATTGDGNAAGGAMAGGSGACSTSGSGTTEAKAGGGALLIECAGALNFTGTIYTKGSTPGSGGGYKQSGSGSAGGMCVVLYNTLTANSGTIDDSGGAGGDIVGQATGGAGGASTGGLVLKNIWFA